MNENMNVIVTSLGTFNVVPNPNGGTDIYNDGVKVCTANETPWWDKDGLVNLIETHKELFKEVGVMSFITRDNVKDALKRIEEVLGKEEKGFYASRIKQCINKLK